MRSGGGEGTELSTKIRKGIRKNPIYGDSQELRGRVVGGGGGGSWGCGAGDLPDFPRILPKNPKGGL